MSSVNAFRILADISHAASKAILIWAIHWNKSAEGVSLLTQALYTLVFLTRYLDLFWTQPWAHWWIFSLKITYILSSFYIVFIMTRVFVRTREKEGGWKLAIWSLIGSIVTAPIVLRIFHGAEGFYFTEILWTFSIILESFCILPQLLLLRQTSVPTVLNSFYLVALGSYRFLYVLNWIYRETVFYRPAEPISIIFGVIQTLFYVDFAWVYYTRQRVKLRGGGVVDSDDLKNSFLVRRFMPTRGQDDDIADEDAALAGQENGTIRPSGPIAGKNWGSKGISVSADDTLPERDMQGASEIADPSHFEDDDEAADAPPLYSKDKHASSSAAEWSDERKTSSQ